MIMTNVNEILDGHVSLQIQCLDRIYLNGYVPNLQVSGQVANFMTKHLGKNIPSPAIMEKIGTAFRRDVSTFAETNQIPVITFGKGDRKIDVMQKHLRAQEATGRSGVAAIGVAQEYQNVFAANKRGECNGVPWFSFTKADRRVTCYYFYLWDIDFGASFIKICAYFPYPLKVWVNGHEWAKRQAAAAGIGFTALSNGFATCADPDRLQAICDRLGPEQIQDFFTRWIELLPVPLTEYDRTFGYWWELSMRQIETSHTIVFDAPRHARAFFEALIVDNLDIGRPESVELLFTGHAPRSRRAHPIVNRTPCKTSIVTRDTLVTMNAFFKHSRIKQYLKDGRALRIETVINSPKDLQCLRRLEHLPELQHKARDINARLLDTERVGQDCVLASPAFERVASPTVTVDGPRLLDGRGIPRRRPPRIHPSEPARPGEPAAGCRLHNQSDELRPGPAADQRADPTPTAQQQLHPHRGRATRRDLLHEDPQPAPAAPDRRRHDPCAHRTQASTEDHRPARHQLHHRSENDPSLKLKTKLQVLATE